MMTKLTLSALSLTAMMGISQGANAGCYCPQGQNVGTGCMLQPNLIVNLTCTADQPRKPAYEPPATTDYVHCQARPNGGKICTHSPVEHSNHILQVIEYDAQGTTIYHRQNKTDGKTPKFENRFNKQGLRQGINTLYYDDGKPMLVQNFVNDQRQGEAKVYNENGQLAKIINFKDDNEMLTIYYQNGKKHGTETEYGYFENDKKGLVQYTKRTATWVNGVKHGNEQFFEPSGKKGKNKLIKTVMWQNGKPMS